MDIEFDVIERRVRDGDGGELAAALEISAEIEAGSHGNLVDADVARDGGSGASADPMQFGVGGGAHAGRITQANIFAGGGEIEVELLIDISGVAFEVERASAGAGGESLDVNVIASEQK